MTKDSEYTKKHKEKRQARALNITLYLDDNRENEIYQQLNRMKNKKQFVLKAIEDKLKD